MYQCTIQKVQRQKRCCRQSSLMSSQSSSSTLNPSRAGSTPSLLSIVPRFHGWTSGGALRCQLRLRRLISSRYIVVCQDTRPLCLDHPPPSARQEIIKRHIILEGYPFRINNLPILDRTLITNKSDTSAGHRLSESLVPSPSPPRRPSFTPLRQLGLRLRNHPEQTLSHLPPCRAPLLDQRDDALVLPTRRGLLQYTHALFQTRDELGVRSPTAAGGARGLRVRGGGGRAGGLELGVEAAGACRVLRALRAEGAGERRGRRRGELGR